MGTNRKAPAKRVRKSKEAQEVVSEVYSVNGNGLIHVKDLHRSELPTVEVDFRGHTLFMRPASIAYRKAMDVLRKKTEEADEAEMNTLILESVSKMAHYLANNLFNDKECTKPVGTPEEFEEAFSPGEMQDLFNQIGEGVKKKANPLSTTQ